MFDALDFSFQAGDFVCLTGKNGSGKSTFLRFLAGFIHPERGGLTYRRADDTFSEIVPDDFLLSGHQNGLKPGLTLRENADFFVRLMTGMPASAAAQERAVGVFSMAALLDEPVQYFSSGQRHRAALMRFALVDRQVWLMDEPTVGLDADNRAALASMITDHIARGGVVVAATHDPLGVPGITLDMDAFQPAGPALEEAWL